MGPDEAAAILARPPGELLVALAALGDGRAVAVWLHDFLGEVDQAFWRSVESGFLPEGFWLRVVAGWANDLERGGHEVTVDTDTVGERQQVTVTALLKEGGS